MRKVICGLAVVGLLFMSNVAMADYVNPPGWEDNPYFTHQSWEFNALNVEELHCPPLPDGPEPVSPGVPGRGGDLPLEPDALGAGAGCVNPYGTPYLRWALPPDDPMGDWSHYSMGGSWTRCGYYGGMGDTALVFEIPNSPQADMQLEMWVQWAYYASAPLEGEGWAIDAGTSYELHPDETNPVDRLSLVSSSPITVTSFPLETGLPGGGSNEEAWYRATARLVFDEQPEMAYVKLCALTGGAATLIDQVDIDTHCVPEPGSLLLLSTGLVSLLGFSRRRRA